jgi:hypothetical protein
MSYAGVRKTSLSLILLQCGKQAFPIARTPLAVGSTGSIRSVASIRLRVIFCNSDVAAL